MIRLEPSLEQPSYRLSFRDIESSRAGTPKTTLVFGQENLVNQQASKRSQGSLFERESAPQWPYNISILSVKSSAASEASHLGADGGNSQYKGSTRSKAGSQASYLKVDGGNSQYKGSTRSKAGSQASYLEADGGNSQYKSSSRSKAGSQASYLEADGGNSQYKGSTRSKAGSQASYLEVDGGNSQYKSSTRSKAGSQASYLEADGGNSQYKGSTRSKAGSQAPPVFLPPSRNVPNLDLSLIGKRSHRQANSLSGALHQSSVSNGRPSSVVIDCPNEGNEEQYSVYSDHNEIIKAVLHPRTSAGMTTTKKASTAPTVLNCQRCGKEVFLCDECNHSTRNRNCGSSYQQQLQEQQQPQQQLQEQQQPQQQLQEQHVIGSFQSLFPCPYPTMPSVVSPYSVLPIKSGHTAFIGGSPVFVTSDYYCDKSGQVYPSFP